MNQNLDTVKKVILYYKIKTKTILLEEKNDKPYYKINQNKRSIEHFGYPANLIKM